MNFMALKFPLWLISKALKKGEKKEEKYILLTVWIVGLIKHFNMDFANVKFPK